MLRIFYVLLALVTVASCLSDERKEYELAKFNRLKHRLYNLNYDVEANFCLDGQYSPANLPNPHFQEKSHRHFTSSLIRIKERFVRAGWDASEFFCTGWKPEAINESFKRELNQDIVPRAKFAQMNVIQKLYELLSEDEFFRSLMTERDN